MHLQHKILLQMVVVMSFLAVFANGSSSLSEDNTPVEGSKVSDQETKPETEPADKPPVEKSEVLNPEADPADRQADATDPNWIWTSIPKIKNQLPSLDLQRMFVQTLVAVALNPFLVGDSNAEQQADRLLRLQFFNTSLNRFNEVLKSTTCTEIFNAVADLAESEGNNEELARKLVAACE